MGTFWASWSIILFSPGSLLKTNLVPIGSMYQKFSPIVGRILSLYHCVCSSFVGTDKIVISVSRSMPFASSLAPVRL